MTSPPCQFPVFQFFVRQLRWGQVVLIYVHCSCYVHFLTVQHRLDQAQKLWWGDSKWWKACLHLRDDMIYEGYSHVAEEMLLHSLSGSIRPVLYPTSVLGLAGLTAIVAAIWTAWSYIFLQCLCRLYCLPQVFVHILHLLYHVECLDDVDGGALQFDSYACHVGQVLVHGEKGDDELELLDPRQKSACSRPVFRLPLCCDVRTVALCV